MGVPFAVRESLADAPKEGQRKMKSAAETKRCAGSVKGLVALSFDMIWKMV